MSGFYGERDMRSYVGNTGFLWKRSIVYKNNTFVGSGRIKRIKVLAILRTKKVPHLNNMFSQKTEGMKRAEAQRRLPSKARRSQAGT